MRLLLKVLMELKGVVLELWMVGCVGSKLQTNVKQRT
jgi:hypothetical protein